MALNWCYNEPWPCVANNSLLSYPAAPKKAYHAAAQSCRPVLLSARLNRFSYKADDLFEAVIWLLNDSPVDIEPGKAIVTLTLGKNSYNLTEWEYGKAKAGQNIEGPRVSMQLPLAAADCLILTINAGEYSSEYRLLYRLGA
ncbi:MAG TPA: hypothetical protein PK733_02540 [Clostridiales bacterium]|nr:hypothetical protein [Clostridiales bacterium]